MDELVNQVSQKTGLPKETAKVAVQTVLDFLKQRLPPSPARLTRSSRVEKWTTP